MIILFVSLVTVAGIFTYSSSNARLNGRTVAYEYAVSAAEAATEKAVAQITADFRDYGDAYVQQRLNFYRTNIPNSAESSVWTNLTFSDNAGNAGRIEAQYYDIPGFTTMGGQYGSLKAWKDRLRVLANVQPRNYPEKVIGTVYQDIELTRIPIFQYAVFYNVVCEFTPQPPMTITGPTHCNTNIYMNPYGTLTFYGDVTSAGNIIEGPNPDGPMPALGGPTFYMSNHISGASSLSLPIGTNNSPAAVRQVIELPPTGESASSSIGQQRYYNKADLVIWVSNTTFAVRSGRWDNFNSALSTNDTAWINIKNTFYNKREQKTIKTIDIDIARLVLWNATNNWRSSFPLRDVTVLYVADMRTIATGYESGVRLVNGTNLPPQGLTVATASPLYIKGHYNVADFTVGSTNTTGTKPASVAADAVTVLSTDWKDMNSASALASRKAGDTTVNAAILTGLVVTTAASDSGGVENFPRFLEDWNSKTLTYNGSMVCMFYSSIATGLWLGIGPAPTGPDIYNPPIRKWAFDQNYNLSDKLPPATPCLAVLSRSSWRTPAPYSTNVLAGF